MLAEWRRHSTLPPSFWNDAPDAALVRSMLGDHSGVRSAIQRFAVAQADAGVTLPECCDHLAALAEALPDASAGHQVWGLAPVVADVFFGDPADWGLDPLTGCLTDPCLHAVLHGLYRRAAALGRPPETSAFLAVLVDRSDDIGREISEEIEVARVLHDAVAEAEAIAHLRRGRFVALVEASRSAGLSDAVLEALTAEGIAAFVRTNPLPPGLMEAGRLLERIQTERRTSR